MAHLTLRDLTRRARLYAIDYNVESSISRAVVRPCGCMYVYICLHAYMCYVYVCMYICAFVAAATHRRLLGEGDRGRPSKVIHHFLSRRHRVQSLKPSWTL